MHQSPYLIQNERYQTVSLVFFENGSHMAAKEISHFPQLFRRV